MHWAMDIMALEIIIYLVQIHFQDLENLHIQHEYVTFPQNTLSRFCEGRISFKLSLLQQ